MQLDLSYNEGDQVADLLLSGNILSVSQVLIGYIATVLTAKSINTDYTTHNIGPAKQLLAELKLAWEFQRDLLREGNDLGSIESTLMVKTLLGEIERLEQLIDNVMDESR